MRKFLMIVFALIWINPASATIFDISRQDGFTTNGASGIFGNGIVFMSPVYTVGFGASVDFGIASLMPDAVDFRSGCDHFGGCGSGYAYNISFYFEGRDAPLSAPFDLLSIPNTSYRMQSCPHGLCSNDLIPLAFTMPDSMNTVQFAFQGTALAILPPIPEASTWIMMLIGFVGISLVAWQTKRTPVFTGV